MKYIIEGIDRLGKSTLVNEIQQELGYHLVIHYDKPQSLKAYQTEENPLLKYQQEVNQNMFRLLRTPCNIIFDRGHLGECVYAPLYRDYSGDYVFDLESNVNKRTTKLILLTTSNFDICVDDGESFDFDNKEKEQDLFIQAFNKSQLSKVLIDVYDGKTKTFKEPKRILHEALNRISD